ncbi:MAG: FmdB family zinc ribbon protein [Nitrospirota bacterium]
MPVYEYECKKCSHRHEVMQKMSDAPVTSCPECQGEVYRLISPSGLSFKGEGWYITDYARKDDKKASEVTEQKKSDTTATSEKKETTPSTPAASSAPQGTVPPASKNDSPSTPSSSSQGTLPPAPKKE